ncbi:MAG TPA: zinc-finger domain-containing protein [Acidobacteriaceae bacterium]|nr:zinc-finger domain-containing protein [Acidobacteriaceae bacterium]
MPDPQTHDRRDLIQPNAANRYEVTIDDLPLSCPMPGMYLWNSHPRVYIPLHKTGEGKCPYCGAEFRLKDFDPSDPALKEHHRRE